MTRRIDISYKTVIFITIFLVLLWIVFKILDILLLFFVAFIFMSALTPLVEKLVAWRIPRVVAVLLTIIFIILLLVGAFAVGLTPFINQTSNLTQKLAEIVSSLSQAHIVDPAVLQQELSKFSAQAVDLTVSLFKNLVGFLSVLVITVYLLLDRGGIENSTTSFFGARQEKAKKVLRMIEEKLGAWLRGQVILSFAVGVLVYAGLLILGVEYALPLAIIAGLLEVVPVLGPIIAAVPAVLIALTVSPLLAALVAGLYLVIQELEGHILVPQIMKRAVGLNPILVILAVSVGGRLLGLGGALLAVPIAVVIQLVLQESFKLDDEPA